MPPYRLGTPKPVLAFRRGDAGLGAFLPPAFQVQDSRILHYIIWNAPRRTATFGGATAGLPSLQNRGAMNYPTTSDRLEAIYAALSEMALGRFHYRAPAAATDPALAAFEKALEALSRLGAAAAHPEAGFARRLSGFRTEAFALRSRGASEDLTVEASSKGLSQLLGSTLQPLEGLPVSSLLATEPDRGCWESIRRALLDGQPTVASSLHFLGPGGAHLPAFCAALSLGEKDRFLLLATLPASLLGTLAPPAAGTSLPARLHDYILERLREALSVPELVSHFEMPYPSLRHAFREAYGTGPFRFHK